MCYESMAGMEGGRKGFEWPGEFGLAMGQTRYRLALGIKVVLRAGDVCWCACTFLIDIKPRKVKGSNTGAFVVPEKYCHGYRREICKQSRARPPRNFSACKCTYMCVSIRRRSTLNCCSHSCSPNQVTRHNLGLSRCNVIY